MGHMALVSNWCSTDRNGCMNISWRDPLGTILVGAVVLVTLSVMAGWTVMGWGGTRPALVTILILGCAANLVARAPQQVSSAIRDKVGWNPYLLVCSALGSLGLVLIIIGFIEDSVLLVVAIAIVMIAIWMVTSAHHAVRI